MERKRITFCSVVFLSFAFGAFVFLQGCDKSSTSATEDSSVSGMAASVVGGAMNSTSSSGTMSLNDVHRRKSLKDFFDPMPDALAATSCPTIVSGTGCTFSASTYTLTYSDCGFGSSAAVWNGAQLVAETGATNPACGTFPSITTGSLVRTFQASTTRTSGLGTEVTLSTATDTTNYTGQSLGGGTTVTFSGGLRTQINVTGIRLTSKIFDHTISTPSPLTVSDSGTTKSVTGNVQVLHNLLKITGTATLNVTFTSDCCVPTGGTINTVFTAGTNGNSNSAYIGKTETLSFSSTCGQGTLVDYTGTTTMVTLDHCF